MSRLTAIVGRVHLVYLGLLPSLATLALRPTRNYPDAVSVLIFAGGVAVVGVYLAVIAGYSRPPASLPAALFTLLDTPAWVLATASRRTWQTMSTDAFLVDGTGIFLAIGTLALTSDRPTSGQRRASIVIVVGALATILAMYWPYLRGRDGEPTSPLMLIVGIVEATLARHLLLATDEPARDTDGAVKLIVPLLIVWIAALIIGGTV